MLLDKSELLGKSGPAHPASEGLGRGVSEEICRRLLWPRVAVGQPVRRQEESCMHSRGGGGQAGALQSPCVLTQAS